MTTFDWVVIAVVALSTLAAFFRGVVRELIALVAWVLGFVGAIAFTPALGAMLPDLPEYPAVRYIVAFALIIIGALLAGALIAWPLSSAVRCRTGRVGHTPCCAPAASCSCHSRT